jgi:hypothetical protein
MSKRKARAEDMMSEYSGETRGKGKSTPNGGSQPGTGERDETKQKTVKTFQRTGDEALSGQPSSSKRRMKPRDDPKTS